MRISFFHTQIYAFFHVVVPIQSRIFDPATYGAIYVLGVEYEVATAGEK